MDVRSGLLLLKYGVLPLILPDLEYLMRVDESSCVLKHEREEEIASEMAAMIVWLLDHPIKLTTQK